MSLSAPPSLLSSTTPRFLHSPLLPPRRPSPSPLLRPSPASATPSLSFSSRARHRPRRAIPFCSLSEAPMEESAVLQDAVASDFLSYARAYWVTRSLIAWNISDDESSVWLFASRNATLFLSDEDIQGYDMKIPLTTEQSGLPENVTQKFPHIATYKAFRLPNLLDAESLLKCQLSVASFSGDGICTNATALQIPGVLDDIFAYSGPLGAIFSKETVTLHLWAPTAQEVNVCFYEDPSSGDLLQRVKLEELNGVWSAVGSRSWESLYYLYEVMVYHPTTLRVETCTVVDPYARGLSSNGRRTLLVNLDDENLKPDGWDNLANEKPELLSLSDISIYELHIRDFSANDVSVDLGSRGGYLAFTSQDSFGICHLKKLSNAGLTHIHLLPSFHFAGVDDDKSNWKCPDEVEMAKLPPDADKQQVEVTTVQDEDGYNWGYNPVIWGVPKGSYASNPNGPNRILEFRKMVQALNRIGLRVVLDVVYNHLAASGPSEENSVLDKIVPGYYLRRNTDGGIENSTCMNNTASEHFMVERLILDDLNSWAVNYKVDGFRFDLMGHIMKSTMVKAKIALQSLSKDKAGVDGSKIYLYGEGWDFGEVANNMRGINASQFNLPGTGIGSFNDRIRDAVLGGSPFGNPLQQGFATGLSLETNGYDQGDKSVTDFMLSTSADHIQVGLAANLKDYVLTCHNGAEMKGSEVMTHDGKSVGYTLFPTEIVNYVSAHDNETLFDIVSLKTPMELSVDERCRVNHLATSIIALTQGIPFFHSGDEMLRSKSLDRDSYNSGDWFNRIDFTYQSNNWGVGLPPREKNEANWPLIKPRLANPSFKPQKHHILAAVDNFVNLLKIRYSSPLFRLRAANDIQERLRFHNTGPLWVRGVIAMSIEDGDDGKPGIPQMDPIYSLLVVIFNACPTQISLDIPELKTRKLQLHPVQLNSEDDLVNQSSYDPTSGSFTVPRRTTSVFVEVRITSLFGFVFRRTE